MNENARERRRFTAAWLNIVSGGLISAGAVSPLAAAATLGAADAALRIACLGAGFVLVAVGLHILARGLIGADAPAPPRDDDDPAPPEKRPSA